MKKQVVLICLISWILLYPLIDELSGLINSYTRIVIEKKEPFSDSIKGFASLINMAMYGLGVGLLTFQFFKTKDK